jgi:hypothetical protein
MFPGSALMTGKAKRRDRRIARAIRRSIESREGLISGILEDPKRAAADSALVRKALRWGGLDDVRRNLVIDRLVTLVEKTGVDRVTKDGELVTDEELADKNAIAASSVLVSIEAQQQRDDHLEARLKATKTPPQQPQTTINVGVNVDNRIDEKRSATLAIAERIRAGRVLQHTDDGGD